MSTHFVCKILLYGIMTNKLLTPTPIETAEQFLVKQTTPPLYHPEDLHVPVMVYSGGNDSLADGDDIEWLLNHLPAANLLGHMTFPEWDHLDFIWAFDAAKYLYSDIIKRIFVPY